MKRLILLSNESDTPLTIEANEYTVTADAMLIPYGDHPHPSGIQRFTRQSAEAMVSGFNSILGKLGRLFGGMPVYIGHPDDKAFANQHTDAKAYAWIMGMEAREDGLALIPKWSKPGEEIVANAHYKWFSPRWACREIARENGRAILEPVRLISVGLTNMPNIAGVPPLANEELAGGVVPPASKEVEMDLLKRLLAVLGLADTVTADDAVARIGMMKAALEKLMASVETRWKAEDAARQALSNVAAEDQLAQVFAGMDAIRAERDAAIAVANEARAATTAERAARVELLVSNAVAAGIITPAQKEQWLKDLADQFEAKSVELSNMKPVLHTRPITRDLGSRKPEQQPLRDKILTLVNTRMSEHGEDYETAFAAVRKENAALFETMKQPTITK
jgi:hypothetical protein